MLRQHLNENGAQDAGKNEDDHRAEIQAAHGGHHAAYGFHNGVSDLVNKTHNWAPGGIVGADANPGKNDARQDQDVKDVE